MYLKLQFLHINSHLLRLQRPTWENLTHTICKQWIQIFTMATCCSNRSVFIHVLSFFLLLFIYFLIYFFLVTLVTPILCNPTDVFILCRFQGRKKIIISSPCSTFCMQIFPSARVWQSLLFLFDAHRSEKVASFSWPCQPESDLGFTSKQENMTEKH